MDLRGALREGNIGVVVGVIVMTFGFALVDFDPSDTELQIVCWSAIGAGLATLVARTARESRRESSRRR